MTLFRVSIFILFVNKGMSGLCDDISIIGGGVLDLAGIKDTVVDTSTNNRI